MRKKLTTKPEIRATFTGQVKTPALLLAEITDANGKVLADNLHLPLDPLKPKKEHVIQLDFTYDPASGRTGLSNRVGSEVIGVLDPRYIRKGLSKQDFLRRLMSVIDLEDGNGV